MLSGTNDEIIDFGDGSFAIRKRSDYRSTRSKRDGVADRATFANDEIIDFGDGSFSIRNRSNYRSTRFEPDGAAVEQSARRPAAPSLVE
jgi:hypothetical protein